MKDYARYQADDFATDPDFARWVLEPRPEDEYFWQEWLLQHPDSQPVIAEARTILHSLNIEQYTISNAAVEEEIQEILYAANRKRKVVPAFLASWKYAAVVAGVIVVGALVFFLSRQFGTTNNNFADNDFPGALPDMIKVVNTGDEQKIIRLEDGSVVHLFPQARIRYAPHFNKGDSRDIYLSGEAFFVVAKEPDKPFSVFTHELVTRVLGTSFTIKANDQDDKISVVVRTGKVSVYSRDTKDDKELIHAPQLAGMVLTPNQQLVYSREQEKFQKILVDQPQLINPSAIKNDFQYDDVPVVTVLQDMKKAYGLIILYDQEVLKNCRITADLSDASVYKKLELICRAMNTRYDIIDGQVIIQNKECK